MSPRASRSPALPREERERRVLDTAAELFYARGVHEVGMDELVRATGFGKATVYRLFPTKDALVGAYLERRAGVILGLVDRDIAEREPADAVRAIFAAIAADVSRQGFRGCAFNNASIEFDDPQHPARTAAREYRAALRSRLRTLGEQVALREGARLGDRLALLVDGMYTSAAHLGPDGPASAGAELAEALLEAACRG
jgi:AcrR family transcriptional regulator